MWQNANANGSEERGFSYSSHPPYVNQFTWSPGRIDYLITDATGATLLAWTVTIGVPTPSTEVPVINYWRFNNVAPAGVRTMRITSFAWAPLGQTIPPLPGGSPPPSPTRPSAAAGPASLPALGTAHGPRGLACVVRVHAESAAARRSRHAVDVNLTMPPSHFALAQFPRDAVLRWSATGVVSLRLAIRRWVRGDGFVRLGALPRSVRPGSGRIHLPGRLAGHRIGRGTYSIGVTPGARCTPGRFVFTIT